MNDITILVVDDESRIRKLIKDFLRQENYTVLEAEDGEDALNVFEQNKNKIDLIILDVMMPKFDGWSVLRKIRQDNTQIPIIMLTARAEEQDELFGFELGVDEYITKPFSPKILVARVNTVLKRTTKKSKTVQDIGGIVIDPEGRTVTVDGKELERDKYPSEFYFKREDNNTVRFLHGFSSIKKEEELTKKYYEINDAVLNSLLIK